MLTIEKLELNLGSHCYCLRIARGFYCNFLKIATCIQRLQAKQRRSSCFMLRNAQFSREQHTQIYFGCSGMNCDTWTPHLIIAVACLAYQPRYAKSFWKSQKYAWWTGPHTSSHQLQFRSQTLPRYYYASISSCKTLIGRWTLMSKQRCCGWLIYL